MNKKIIVSTLALAMGAALAGSVSGTVAWFQYSTRAQAAFIGTSAHCSEALEIQAVKSGNSVDSTKWTTDLSSTAIQAAVTGGTDLQPISSMAMGSTDALPTSGDPAATTFYKNPIYQFTNKSTWSKAVAANYVQFDLYFHVRDINSTVSYLAKDLYLTDLTIKAVQSDNSELDLSKAVRVHFATNESTATNNLFANDGSTATTVNTNVYGNLDLNKNGSPDKGPGYEWDNRGDALVYGDANAQQVAKNASGTNVLASDADPYAIVANSGKIGSIPASEAGFKVTVTIWLEGWTAFGSTPAVTYTAEEAASLNEASGAQPSDDNYISEGDVKTPANPGNVIWDETTYVGKKFQVGMRFAVEAHKSTDHSA